MFCCSFCRGQAMGIELNKVRGVWRLQAPMHWQTYIRTCRKIAPALLPPHPPARPWKLLDSVRRWLTRSPALSSASATAPVIVVARQVPASAAPAHQATQSAARATARAGSIEMVLPAASQLSVHRAAADLAMALNEQWMWHGTSCQVRCVRSAR